MVKIGKIYTKTGDDGTTGLVGGQRIAKDALRVEAYGDVDELNSVLGIIRTDAANQKLVGLSEKLQKIQNQLFDLGCELATPANSDWKHSSQIESEQVQQLEKWIDEISSTLPELRSFVLPGGTELNAFLHLARTVCRRAERKVVRLSKSEKLRSEAIVYLNRLSDLLFAMARQDALRVGGKEFLWE